jgi:hypothetical protein
VLDIFFVERVPRSPKRRPPPVLVAKLFSFARVAFFPGQHDDAAATVTAIIKRW